MGCAQKDRRGGVDTTFGGATEKETNRHDENENGKERVVLVPASQYLTTHEDGAHLHRLCPTALGISQWVKGEQNTAQRAHSGRRVPRATRRCYL